MILHLDGNINRYYVETLVMLFFPGIKFAADELPGPDVPELHLRVYRDGESTVADATFSLDDRLCSATGIATPGEEPFALSPEKLAVGRAIFSAGKQFLGYTPPWGILTGVRPSKVASKFLIEGKGVQRTRRILRDEFLLNPKKAALVVSVASTEMKLTKRLPDNLCSVYISIPFCPSRCAYCSFVSYTSAKLLSMIDDYLTELYRDIDQTFATIRELGMQVATVYIGGGTPTTLDATQLDLLLSRITSHVDPSSLMEFTLEAGRPDTITEDKLAVAKQYGVTRISVNPQTLSDEVLQIIGRKHTVDDFFRAYEIAERSGIQNINVDLIAGLPGDRFGSFASTFDRVVALRPSNLTIHTFCVKKASDFLRTNSKIYSLTGGDVSKCVEYSQLQTKPYGYKPYYIYRQKNTVGNFENVGYAKEGAEGMYNIFMMEELHSIFAVGAGAVTKLMKNQSFGKPEKIERIFSPKYPYEYLRDARTIREGDPEKGIPSLHDKILSFYRNDR